MTIGTLTLFALTGSLVSLKLAVMVLAVVVLAKTVFSRRPVTSPGVALTRVLLPHGTRH